MKLKKQINPRDYGFEQWVSGVWYYTLPVIEGDSDISLTIDGDELALYLSVEYDTKQNGEFLEFNELHEIPLPLIGMIKDGVLGWKD